MEEGKKGRWKRSGPPSLFSAASSSQGKKKRPKLKGIHVALLIPVEWRRTPPLLTLLTNSAVHPKMKEKRTFPSRLPLEAAAALLFLLARTYLFSSSHSPPFFRVRDLFYRWYNSLFGIVKGVVARGSGWQRSALHLVIKRLWICCVSILHLFASFFISHPFFYYCYRFFCDTRVIITEVGISFCFSAPFLFFSRKCLGMTSHGQPRKRGSKQILSSG